MFILIVLCGLVTLIIRVVPFLMISRIQLSETVIKWLSFIPITLFDTYLRWHYRATRGRSRIYTQYPICFSNNSDCFVALFTRSLTTTILVGIVLIAGLRFFF